MKKTIILLLCIFNAAFATQIREVVDGSELSFNISVRDLNRIKVMDDRIQTLSYRDDELVIANVEHLGEVYIRPANNNMEPITGFIITEKGYTYKLRFVPQNISSTQIMLKNVESIQSSRSSNDISDSSPEKKEIAELIKLMATTIALKNAKYNVKSTSGIWFSADKIEARKVMIFEGENLTGMKLLLKNKTEEEIKIAEKTFYRDGVRAVSLDTNILAPKASINLYIVLQ